MSVQFRKHPSSHSKRSYPTRILKIIFTSSTGVYARKTTENAIPRMLVKSEIVTDSAPLDLDPLVGLADDPLPEREAPEPVAAEAPLVEAASEAKSVKTWVLWYV